LGRKPPRSGNQRGAMADLRIYGENQISIILKKSISDFLEGKTANAQKNNLKAVRLLIRFAISQGELAHDPTEDIQPVKAPKTMWAT
jgi:site-specific recombinase XerC